MQKFIKRISVITVVFAIVIASTLTISAAVIPGDSTQSTYINNATVSFSRSGLTSTAIANVTGASNVTKVKIKLEIQKKSGDTYTTVETFEKTVNGKIASLSGNHTINPLSTYRAKATVTAYSGTSYETKTLYGYAS